MQVDDAEKLTRSIGWLCSLWKYAIFRAAVGLDMKNQYVAEVGCGGGISRDPNLFQRVSEP